MGLRAKKPEIKKPRLKTLLYAGEGAGKTYFCCSMPDTYYIDTENLEDYPQFVEMIKSNNGDLIYLPEISEIIAEVSTLLSTKHNYKTLVIDSISFPYAWLAQMEADRLQKKGANIEGTEFGANLAKAKRLTFQLGILLSRLDMNVIVTAHEKTKFEDNVEKGKTYDITDKMAYSLGSVWNLRLIGKSRKLFVKKSRYLELKNNEILDFENGYETLKEIFGEEIFTREAKEEILATTEQIEKFNHLTEVLQISEERINKLLTNAQATSIEEMSSEFIQKVINKMQKDILGEK